MLRRSNNDCLFYCSPLSPAHPQFLTVSLSLSKYSLHSMYDQISYLTCDTMD